jgi:hypothetical protein
MTSIDEQENKRLRAIDLVIAEIADRRNRSLALQIHAAQHGMGREIDEFYEELIETAKVIRQSYV